MNHHPINNTAGKIGSLIALITIALFPLIILPVTPNFSETNKLMFLVIATALLLLVWAGRSALTKRLKITFTPLSLPFFVYGLFHFASSFISTPNTPAEALMDRGGLMMALGLFVLAAANLIDNRKFVRNAIYTLIGSGTALAVVTIFQSFGFGLSNLINQVAGTQLPNSLDFTPAGSPVALLSLLGPVMLLGLYMAITKKDAAEKVSLFVLTSLMAAAFIVTSVYSFPGRDTSPVFLPFRVGYAIAIETLKTPQTALVGVGTNSFVVAYNQFRPGIMNASEFWNVRFNISTNEILQILTTVGVIGLGLFGWLVSSIIRTNRNPLSGTQAQAVKIATFAILLLFILLPATYPLLFAFAVLLLLWSLMMQGAGQATTYEVGLNEHAASPQTAKRVALYAPIALVVLLTAASLYFAGRAYSGEVTFKQALDAAAANDGIRTYDLQREAILKNPLMVVYRRAYATTNLALADSIASNEELSDEDQYNIGQLIQQAIREAKIAVSLEPQNSANWETLAFIYRALINAAEEADEWTVASLSQAIQTDPMNPRLRVELGGVYFSLGAYDQAIRLFQQAAELKPDYANAYYNLSHSFREKEDPIAAYDAMQVVLALVQPDSADYGQVKDELAELAKALPQQDQAQGAGEIAPPVTNLQPPAPAPSPVTAVDLPAGSGPDTVVAPVNANPQTDINP
jgi:tetratricopeptide (TPR) repeat protein